MSGSAGPSVEFFVQSVPGREAWPVTEKCLAESDVGDYVRVLQADGGTARETFVSTMLAMAASDAEWVVRLEDDLAGVNRFLLYNVQTWPAKLDKHFGAGWLFAPGGGNLSRSHDLPVSVRWVEDVIHGALGVLFRKTFVMEVLWECLEWFEANPGRGGDDLAIGNAVRRLGKRIAIHAPSLLEHNTGPSASGHTTHPLHDTSNGWFDREWRRP